MNWVQNLVVKLFHITPAAEKQINIYQAYTFQENIQKNKIWYNGEPAELEQFFKKIARWDCERTRFWAAIPHGKIRKIHSGIVSMVIDRYKDIVMADYNGISFGKDSEELEQIWKEIEKNNHFTEVVSTAVQKALSEGDGAFKISTDPEMKYPVIEFYSMENVSFRYRYGQLKEIIFYTDYKQNGKTYRLEETYGIGYLKFKLFDEAGKECLLNLLPETKKLEDTEFDGDFIMGIPFIIFHSTRWQGRGKALFDTKTDVLDALDETISQWLDAIRLGRIKRYIPNNLIPRDETTGELLPPNPFDNDFISIEDAVSEDGSAKIDVSQPAIAYEAYVNSYCSFLDMVLQGIISPATLGIDLKKTDNAEAQREKEKITLHVRGKIIEALNTVLPELIIRALSVYYVAAGKNIEHCEPVLKFGEYASPDFDSTVETISKSKQSGIMSIETVVDELYGDSKDEEWKAGEVLRLKAEQGIVEMEEPQAADDAVDFIEDDMDEKKLGSSMLNGAQVGSLMNIIKMVKTSQLTRSEAINIVTATLGVSKESAETFIEENL